ncbi:ROK family protein [Lacticaseibacillus porcinae]|uniref:ROK family protein n=1 Tax=Lacticaseibacillus porcinae TaxID=1123687 RepID=UPI000F7AE7D7|nr:ROK family protein [Lacticaseibacillus porcinae]
MHNYVSFDIGGTTIKYGLVTGIGEILAHDAVPTPSDRAELLGVLSSVVKQYADQHPQAIGISVPGIVQRDGFMITGGAIDCLYECPLGELVSTATGLPVHVENDANAATIAEAWLGAAQGVKDYLLLALGTGIGGGIVINGEVFRGAHGMAGEIGWNVTHEVDWTDDLEASSLNFHAAVVSGLVRRYNASLKRVDHDADEVVDARDIITLAHQGDAIATPIYHDFIVDVGIMCCNLFATLDPELILIGGGISANDQFIADLQAMVDELETRHTGLSHVKARVLGKVVAAGLRNNAGLLGAVYPLVEE